MQVPERKPWEAAFDDGREAYEHGLSLCHNYYSGNILKRAWADGWAEAARKKDEEEE